MKLFLSTLFITLLFSIGNQQEEKSKVKIRSWELKENDFFEIREADLSEMRLYFDEDQLKHFNDKTKVFEFSTSSLQEEEIFNCEKEVLDLKSNFTSFCLENNNKDTPENFTNFWQERLRLCYLKYKKTAPTLAFTFQKIGEQDFILDSVGVYIYMGTIPLASDNKYFVDQDVSKETIVIDPKLAETKQLFKLKKKYLINDPLHTMELRLTNKNYWSGTFSKDTYAMELYFIFSNSSTEERIEVKSSPFVIDL